MSRIEIHERITCTGWLRELTADGLVGLRGLSATESGCPGTVSGPSHVFEVQIMVRRWLAVVVLVLSLPAVSSAQVKLVRQLKENSESLVETSTKIQQSLKIAGMNQQTANEGRRLVRAKSGKRDDLGRLRVEEKIEEFEAHIQAPNGNYDFDSKSRDAAGNSALEQVRPLHKALLQQPVTMVYDKDDSVSGVEFDQQFLNNLSPEIQVLVKGQFDAENLKRAAKQSADRLPMGLIQKGSTWERTETTNLGAGQQLSQTAKYTYEGTVEKDGKSLDRITFVIEQVSFALDPNSPLPLKLKGSNLKPEKSGGEILFDQKSGQIVEETQKIVLKGTIDFEIQNMPLPSELDLQMEFKTIRK